MYVILSVNKFIDTVFCVFSLAAISQDNFSMKDLPLLIEKLSSVSARWNLLGIQLEIDPNLLSGFEQETKLYLANTLALWSKQRKPPSALMKALRGPTLRRTVLADNLKDKYGSKMGKW